MSKTKTMQKIITLTTRLKVKNGIVCMLYRLLTTKVSQLYKQAIMTVSISE